MSAVGTAPRWTEWPPRARALALKTKLEHALLHAIADAPGRTSYTQVALAGELADAIEALPAFTAFSASLGGAE